MDTVPFMRLVLAGMKIRHNSYLIMERISMKAWKRESLLHWACCSGKYAIVQLLLRNGAKINLCKESKASPICSDCYRRHDSIPSPLYGACVKGQFSTAQLLISMGADINQCLEDGISPLFAACKNENDNIVQLLLSNGADVNLSRRDGCSPLHEACKTGHDITVSCYLRMEQTLILILGKT